MSRAQNLTNQTSPASFNLYRGDYATALGAALLVSVLQIVDVRPTFRAVPSS
jgi:hypothetical protein